MLLPFLSGLTNAHSLFSYLEISMKTEHCNNLSQEWMSHGKSFLWMLLTPGSGDDRYSKCSHPLPPKGEEPQYQLPRLLFTNTIPRRFPFLSSPPFINIIPDFINLPAMVFLLLLTNTDTDLFNTWFGLKIVQLSVGKLISWRFSAN